MGSRKQWSDNDLNLFKKLIITKKRETEIEIAENKKRADAILDASQTNAIYSSHMADASGDHVEMEKAYYFVARQKTYISFLNKALHMIDNGTFGICVGCNELIPKDRLLEVPHTTKCVDCKENRQSN